MRRTAVEPLSPHGAPVCVEGGSHNERMEDAVLSQLQLKAERMVRKYASRPVKEGFIARLERWRNYCSGNGVFFRPTPLYLDECKLPHFPIEDRNGASAEVAMLVWETHGVIVPVRDVETFVGYLQGKSIEGLSRRMWQEDMFSGSFWAEELVISGLVGFKEAERMFKRKLNGELLWFFGATSEEVRA